MVTLEGFLQFKEQCHENDKFLKTVPPKDSGEVSDASESFEDGDAMECVFLDMNDDGVGTRDSEEDGLVEEAEPPPETSKKTVTLASPKKEATKTTQMQPEKLITSRRENLFGVEPMSRVRKQIAKPASSPRTDLIALGKVLQEQYRCPEPTENDLPKLLDSYPDTFHFVKSTPKSKFYTLVYYGEPYQSAVYEYNKTYYRCAYKRKFDCPAVLHASNDYTEFTRRFEHNHDEQEPIYSNLPPKSKIKPVLLTPRQALPDIFRRCWRKVEEINPELESDAIVCFDCIVTLEGFFQFKEQCHVNDEFLKTLPPRNSAEQSDASEVDEAESALDSDDLEQVRAETVNDSEEEGLVQDEDAYEPPAGGRIPVKPPAKKINSIKVEPEVDTRRSSRVRKPTAKALAIKLEPVEPPQKLKKLETPNIREPTAEELPKLQASYPDYFHFERGPRSVYYNLMFYGERYNSAIYGTRFTFWQCAYRRANRCPAMVRVTNDYTSFERRFEHTHGDLPEKGEHDLFTPKQALPEVFRICWQKEMMRKLRKESAGPMHRYPTATEGDVSDGEDEFDADQDKGALQNVLRKSGVLDSDDD